MSENKYIFLGGVPKSGTSSLFDMLGKIPGICASTPKETFYLIDNDYLIKKDENFFNQGWSNFDRFFKDKECKVRLEGTTHLIYQEKIIPSLKDRNAYFVFVLRSPEERIRSSFEYSMNNLASFNKKISFSEFVNIFLDNPNELLKYSSRENALKNIAQGKKIADYPELIRKWRSQIPEERLIIIDYEYYKQNPQKTIGEILNRFCPEISFREIRVSNNNKTTGIKNIKLHNWLKGINKKTQDSLIKKFVKKVYFKFQHQEIERNDADAKALLRLKNAFNFNYKDLCDESFKIN